jgi:hypothetical protein
MQPVSEERLEELYREELKRKLGPYATPETTKAVGKPWFLAGARAYEKELGVNQVLDVPSSPSVRRCYDCEAWDVHESCCALSDLCPSEGTILIRAKERKEHDSVPIHAKEGLSLEAACATMDLIREIAERSKGE